LLALATPAQLTAVFDLDLWKPTRAGADEQFDAARFLEWLEVLVDADPVMAAARLASMDAALVVAGLSPHLTVWDPAVFEPTEEPSSADPVLNAGRERGVHAEIGGYLVVARRQDTWDPIVEALSTLAERHPDSFHRVMQDCRRLSNSGREIDGLDDLLSDAEQVRFDVAAGREERRDRLGFLPPDQARAFLASARHILLAGEPPERDLVFAAHQRSQMTNETPMRADSESREAQAAEPAADDASAVVTVMEILRGAGVLADSPRLLLPGKEDEQPAINAALSHYLQHFGKSEDDGGIARHQELAFLANALMSGCSVQARPFTEREAMDAVAATCNLGLECWPPTWRPSREHDLITVFQVGWTVLHREVAMVTADRLLDALSQVQSSDQDVQFGIRALRRELRKQRQAGTPWRARQRLEVLATLDLPAWAALMALFDECPVMLSNVRPARGRRPHRVDPAEFQFIASGEHIIAVHEFLHSLVELLT
jgi:hypothetical protein